MHFLEGLSLNQIAAMYQVNKSTISRRMAKARETLLERTRSRLERRCRLPAAELDSLLEQLGPKLDLSLTSVLEPEHLRDGDVRAAAPGSRATARSPRGLLRGSVCTITSTSSTAAPDGVLGGVGDLVGALHREPAGDLEDDVDEGLRARAADPHLRDAHHLLHPGGGPGDRLQQAGGRGVEQVVHRLPAEPDAHQRGDARHARAPRPRPPGPATRVPVRCENHTPARPTSTTADDQTSVEKCSASASRAWLRCRRATAASARERERSIPMEMAITRNDHTVASTWPPPKNSRLPAS